MSWLFSQVLVGEYLGDICSDGEQSVQSNGNHTQQAYCLPDKMTEYSRLSRFGMMFKPLMESHGEELLMLFRADFPVKTFQLQTQKVTDLTENGQECGERWHGLFARYDPSTHSLKTVQCSLFEDLTESLQTFPRWGLMQNGVCWEQPMLEQITKGTEFGLSEKMPTPNSWDAKRGPMSKELMETGKHQVSLVTYVKHNPKKWGTPKAQDSRHALRDRGKGNLGEQVSGLHNGGKLNPLWTEWLMGWPIGWTDLKPLEMDKCPYVQQQHGTFLKED
jgi:hypothetical protein